MGIVIQKEQREHRQDGDGVFMNWRFIEPYVGNNDISRNATGVMGKYGRQDVMCRTTRKCRDGVLSLVSVFPTY